MSERIIELNKIGRVRFQEALKREGFVASTSDTPIVETPKARVEEPPTDPIPAKTNIEVPPTDPIPNSDSRSSNSIFSEEEFQSLRNAVGIETPQAAPAPVETEAEIEFSGDREFLEGMEENFGRLRTWMREEFPSLQNEDELRKVLGTRLYFLISGDTKNYYKSLNEVALEGDREFLEGMEENFGRLRTWMREEFPSLQNEDELKRVLGQAYEDLKFSKLIESEK